jgi:hypothetical protein
MTWTALVTVACLLALGEFVQLVDGFAVVQSVQDDKPDLANSEGNALFDAGDYVNLIQ